MVSITITTTTPPFQEVTILENDEIELINHAEVPLAWWIIEQGVAGTQNLLKAGARVTVSPPAHPGGDLVAKNNNAEIKVTIKITTVQKAADADATTQQAADDDAY